MLHENDDLERMALERHRLTELLAPQVLENPVFFHATDTSEDGWKKVSESERIERALSERSELVTTM